MRIALFTYSTQPRGGVLHALALAEALDALGHAATLFALDDGRGFIRTPRCATVRIAVDAAHGDLASLVQHRIAAYVDAWNSAAPPYDVYHAHDGISGNALATLVECGRIPAFVRTVHHLDHFADAQLAALQDRSIVRASRLLVVSAIWRERIGRAYGRAADIVPSGVDTTRFFPVAAAERRQLRAHLGIGRGPLFVTIGGVEPRKNTRALLEAFALVVRVQPAAQLIIAGGASVFAHSEYRRAFAARAEQLGLPLGTANATGGRPARTDAPAAVTLAGVQTDTQIVTLLRAADAFVFPSLVEGFGLVLLEAAACGTPLIASALAPFTEYLTADDAQLVDSADTAALARAMQRALDPAVAARAARRGPALASRFSWAASAQAHATAYQAYADASRAGVYA